MAEKVLFTVPDMTCGGCKAKVTHALKEVPGVIGVEADVPSRQVSVEVDRTVPIEALAAAVARAGYTFEK